MRLVDLKGREVVKAGKYDLIMSFHEGMALVLKKNSELATVRGFINQSGAVVVPVECEEAYVCSEGVMFVCKSNVWTGVDTNGVTVIQGNFERCTRFGGGLAGTQDKATGLWGYIDHSGKWVIEPKYSGAMMFSEGLGAVLVDGKWGFIDRSGKMVVEPQFEKAGDVLSAPVFNGGLAKIRQGRKLGYINRSGQWVWPLTE